jgi:hypothetical protein
VQEVAGTSALLLFALTAIDCACRHGQACEALVSQGKEPLLVLLEQKQQPPVGQLLRRILHCLSVYQIATTFELTVQQLTKESSSKRITAEEAVAIDEVTILLTELLGPSSHPRPVWHQRKLIRQCCPYSRKGAWFHHWQH